MKRKSDLHTPVLVEEVVTGLKVKEYAHLKKQGWYVDATLGTGGHTLELLKLGVNVIGLEWDEETLETAKTRIEEEFQGKTVYKLFNTNFTRILEVLDKKNISEVLGILVDLGVNSVQLTSRTRGFSYLNEKSELDMRIDRKGNQVKAKDLLNFLREDQLMEMFRVTMDYPEAKTITKDVLSVRESSKFNSVGDFTKLFESRRLHTDLHPSTKALLALRIAVNSEIVNLKEALPDMFDSLARGGRLAVISFHSGEDTVVKTFFRKLEAGGIGRIITKKPVVPGTYELATNPRSRSAKLRIIEKL